MNQIDEMHIERINKLGVVCDNQPCSIHFSQMERKPYKFVTKEEIYDPKAVWDPETIIARLLAERDAYRQVAIETASEVLSQVDKECEVEEEVRRILEAKQ